MIELKEPSVGAMCHVVIDLGTFYNEQVGFPEITGVSPTGTIGRDAKMYGSSLSRIGI